MSGSSGRSGSALIMFTVMIVLVVGPIVGLAIDGAILYLIQAKLSAAVDAAALAGARSLSAGLTLASQTASAEATAQTYFTANFPTGIWRTYNPVFTSSVTQTSLKIRTVAVQVTVTAPLYFMNILGHSQSSISASSQASRRDVNMMLVLDRSSSMASAGVCGTMVASAQNFVNRFTNGRDTIGLITFTGSSSLDYAPTVNFLSNTPSLPTVIGTLVCGGNTGSAEALWLAYQQLISINEPGALNLIVFFTDGLANGVTAAYPKKLQTDVRWNSASTAQVSTPPSSCTGAGPFTGFIAQWANWVSPGPTNGIFNQTSTSITDPNENLISAPGCAFISNSQNVRQDIAYVPTTDIYGNQTIGYTTVASDYYTSGPYTGQLRVDTPSSIQHVSANAADNAAARIRADTSFTPVIYCIGLGGTVTTGQVDPVFLNRVANTPQSSSYNSSQASGIYVYAPTAAELASAFETVVSQILRLSQ
jgi:Flp pilus assembly protein TadG